MARSSTCPSDRVSRTAPGPTPGRSGGTSGWDPIVSFEEGVAKMIEHIEDWRSAPLWTPETIDAATQHMVSVSWRDEARLPAQDQDPGRAHPCHRATSSPEHRHHVSRHVRYRPSGTSPPPHVRQGEGGYSRRQPHVGRARHQGRPAPVRATGASGGEPGGARDGGLRHHRSVRDADRTHQAPAARLLRQGLRILRGGCSSQDPGGDCHARELRR